MMIFATLAALAPKTLAILFIGNSHTSTNDVPGLVQALLTHDRSGRKVTTQSFGGAFLNDVAKATLLPDILKKGKFDIVVLQGAMLSSSHKYTYSQEGGIALANMAKKAGARPLLFAEWPRRGWDEAQYIIKIYEEIARPTGSEIVPIPWVFRKTLELQPKLNAWQGDGNHATMVGSYLAAASIYFQITKQHLVTPDWRPAGMSEATSKFLLEQARLQHEKENPD